MSGEGLWIRFKPQSLSELGERLLLSALCGMEVAVAAQELDAPSGWELAKVTVGLQHIKSGIEFQFIGVKPRQTDRRSERLPAVTIGTGDIDDSIVYSAGISF